MQLAAAIACFFLVTCSVYAEPADALAPWRSSVTIEPVAANLNRHSIHAYFNTCPESPDGKFVLYYTSGLRMVSQATFASESRSSGKETTVATDITAEDAHRAACQQWSNGGKTIVYHDLHAGHWQVMAADVATGKTKVLARDRQVAFGWPNSQWVPIYGCHWNPGKHRDLQLVNVVTGQIRTAVSVKDVVAEYGDWIEQRFGTTEISIFFPIMSPGDKQVFFKLSRPSGGNDFRAKSASSREGLVVYDLENQRFVRLITRWGHPSWSPDGKAIFNIGNIATNVASGESQAFSRSCISNHPTLSPSGQLFVTDADVTKRKYGAPGDWAIAVGSTSVDDFVLLHVFGNTQGAQTWRHNHPHPAFSADGKRVYYNVNQGRWTTLMVAQSAEE